MLCTFIIDWELNGVPGSTTVYACDMEQACDLFDTSMRYYGFKIAGVRVGVET